MGRSIAPKGLRQRLRGLLRNRVYTVLLNCELQYAEDNLYTANTAPFLADERFRRAYAAGEATNSWSGLSIRWRVYIACWAAERAAALPGDFIEFGVNRGGLARSIVEYLDFNKTGKKFLLVDTFSGLVTRYLSDTERARGLENIYAYYKSNSILEVRRTFAAFRTVELVEGVVPDILPQIEVDTIAYATLDMNCTLPEIRAAEFLWDRLVCGGVLLLDDYGQKLHSEQQVAFDAFATARGVSVLCLPTGQGLILKP